MAKEVKRTEAECEAIADKLMREEVSIPFPRWAWVCILGALVAVLEGRDKKMIEYLGKDNLMAVMARIRALIIPTEEV